jgi:integrase
MDERYILLAQNSLILQQQAFIKYLIEANTRDEPVKRQGDEGNEVVSVLFKDYARQFLERKKAVTRKSTYTTYLWQIEKRIIPYFGNMPLESIDNRVIQSFVNKEAKTSAVKSVREYAARVKEILNEAAEEEVIKSHLNIRLRYPMKGDAGYQVYNNEEYEALRRYLLVDKTPAATGILIALTEGLRIGEVSGLKWEDVDFKNRTIEIKRTVYRVYNTITSRSEIVIGPTKTKAGNRVIPIHGDIETELLSRRDEPDIYIASGREYPLEPRTLRQNYIRKIKKAGVRYIKFHDLRHNFATRAIERGMDPKTLSAILGHSNSNVTLNIYTSVTEDMKRKGMGLM